MNKQNHKLKKQICKSASILAIILVIINLAIYQLPVNTRQGGNNLYLVVEWTDKQGTHRIEKVNDIFLDNWVTIWESIFDNDASESVTLTNYDGTTVNVHKGTAGEGIPFFTTGTQWANSWFIAIGTSSLAVDKDQYSLDSYYEREHISEPVMSVDGNVANITFSASFTFSESVTIREVAFLVDGVRQSTGSYSSKDVYFTRDLTGDISKTAAESATFTYIFQYNTP